MAVFRLESQWARGGQAKNGSIVIRRSASFIASVMRCVSNETVVMRISRSTTYSW